MRKQWNRVLLVVLVLVVVIFSVLNVDPVNINFGFTTVEMPLVLVIIGTLLIGVIIAAISSTSMVYRERNEKRKLEKQLDNYDEDKEKEQEELKENHRAQVQSLEDELEQSEQENRKLQRRIKNLETKQESPEKKQDNITDV